MTNPYSNYSTKHTSQICQHIHGIYEEPEILDGGLLRNPLPSPIVIQAIIPVNSIKGPEIFTELRYAKMI